MRSMSRPVSTPQPSILGRLMPTVIRLRGSKRLFSSAERMRARVEKQAKRPPLGEPPRRLSRRVDVSRATIGGWPVYEVSPRGRTVTRRALYLHGGAYVFQIAPQHWGLVAELAAATGARITVPIFPLAPDGVASAIVPAAADLAEAMVAEVGADRVTVIGDSAGGGMALAVAMTLRDRGSAPLGAIILISPWLDISGTDPELAEIEPRDPWLAVPGSHAAGALYRAELAEDDFRVSPIHGDLAQLGPVTMFTGTRDILNADAHRLIEKAAGTDLRLEVFEAPEMIHVYPLLPIGEARRARRIIRDRMI